MNKRVERLEKLAGITRTETACPRCKTVFFINIPKEKPYTAEDSEAAGERIANIIYRQLEQQKGKYFYQIMEKARENIKVMIK